MFSAAPADHLEVSGNPDVSVRGRAGVFGRGARPESAHLPLSDWSPATRSSPFSRGFSPLPALSDRNCPSTPGSPYCINFFHQFRLGPDPTLTLVANSRGTSIGPSLGKVGKSAKGKSA